jgi:hypothetical protein
MAFQDLYPKSPGLLRFRITIALRRNFLRLSLHWQEIYIKISPKLKKVFEEKMLNDQPLKHRPLKADLHIHTAEDPLDRVPYTAQELIVKAATEGFEILAITWRLRGKKPSSSNHKKIKPFCNVQKLRQQ